MRIVLQFSKRTKPSEKMWFARLSINYQRKRQLPTDGRRGHPDHRQDRNRTGTKAFEFCLRVCDNAEGMTAEDLDNKVGRYGEATSGFREGRSVRGLWGRG